MIYIGISETIEEEASALDAVLLSRAAEETMRSQDASPDTELTIALDDDERLHKLNRQFLNVDSPTDVLSFPSGEEGAGVYLGDVIISLPRAREQAEAAGHPLEAELQLLTVHGVLHLFGYDHAGEEEKAEMWEQQNKILANLGVGDLGIP